MSRRPARSSSVPIRAWTAIAFILPGVQLLGNLALRVFAGAEHGAGVLERCDVDAPRAATDATTVPCRRQSSRGPLTQHITLELGQQGEDAEDELAGGRGRIDNVLGERLQLHATGVQHVAMRWGGHRSSGRQQAARPPPSAVPRSSSGCPCPCGRYGGRNPLWRQARTPPAAGIDPGRRAIYRARLRFPRVSGGTPCQFRKSFKQ